MNEPSTAAKQAAVTTAHEILIGKAQDDSRTELEWLIDQITEAINAAQKPEENLERG
jgi:hypothetical protein